MENNYLDNRSVWVFTKQDTNFDEAIKATRLFASICEDETINIENYFTEHHAEFGINTDRHRILIIPQLFGLMTKTPFYERGGQYSKERPTEIFDKIKGLNSNDYLYNTIKTEQILKIKIHAIIDTANNNQRYNVLPVLFIYKVLKLLKEQGINEISIDQLYTYVMTCKSYDEVHLAVDNIKNDAPIDTETVNRFKSVSRVLTVIRNNISLFNITSTNISINPDYDEYFETNFLARFDIDELHEYLLRDVDYSYFLYNYQNFDVNLIDQPPTQSQTTTKKKPDLDDEIEEKEYQEKVNAIKENNVNDDVADDSYKTPPVVVQKANISVKFEKNPILGKIAIKKAYYTCECDREHKTFISKTSGKQYMEAHHLIPMAYQVKIWEKYQKNIDCLENLVSLCPICHKAFHYGTDEVKINMIEDLYNKIQYKYQAIHFDIPIEEVKQCYGIKK
ncbi:MAG: HNH endonuclease [Bacteroidales bacterium]|jgi:5-methylcytosine-specific restriction endonuclease McrA|nr:HNH endonuclease [Bacteroidales bacterium]